MYMFIQYKKITFFFACIFAVSAIASAQNIYFSEPQKISTELIGFDILGKTKNGELIIYKKYRFEDEIDILDKQMNIKRHKEITVKTKDCETIEVEKLNDDIFHFYTYKENKMNYLECQRYNSDFEKKGLPQLIDSSSARAGDDFSEFKIERSPESNFMMVYKYAYSGGHIDKLFSIVLNDDGIAIQKNEINLHSDNFNPDLVKELVTDDGQPVFLFVNNDFSCRREKSTNIQYQFILPTQGNQFLSADIANNTYCIKELTFDIDNTTGNIIACGFLSDDTKNAMLGYTFMKIATASAGIIVDNNYLFTQEMLDEIAGNTEKSVKYLPLNEITKIIPRMDGGVLIISEYFDKTVENYEYTNYDPYYGYRTSTRQVEFYEYDDILLLSVDTHGNLNWNNVIRKKQMSREDKGVNSSFSTVVSKQKLFFIFNEDVTQNSNVLEYEMLSDGTLDRKSLFNANQQEVQIRPAAGEQVSYNEIIIPSIYKKELTFVKLVF